MGLLDRINARLAPAARPQNLSMDEYASWFSFGGSQYPLLQTTYSQVDQERIAQTADWAAKTSGPVFSLILARMQVFSQVRFQWTRFQGSQPGDLFGTPELSVLEKPWPGGTTVDLLARMEWDASAAGNAYIRRKGSTLHRLNPSWVIIVLGSQEDADNPWAAADTTVAGYLYVPPGGQQQFFLPSQICHYAPLPDPDRHFLGMSWITPVLRDLQGDQAATEHKYRFFENAATPNMAIRFDPTVSAANVKAFMDLFNEEHRGARNAYKTLFLGGGGDPVAIGSNFKDMDYAVVQGRAESRLASAAGVPPSWVSFFEGMQGSTLNSGNYDSARRRFSDGTMAHLWANAAASLQTILTPPDSGASLWYDQRIPFMREDAKDLASVQSQEAQTIAALIRDGFIPDTVVAAVRTNDWAALKHSGLTSVQLLPPSSGQEPAPGFSPETPPGPEPASTNGKGVTRR